MVRLVLLVLTLLAGAASAQSRGAFVLDPGDGSGPLELYTDSFALVIGNDAYSAGWPRLANAARDAEAVAADLTARGFQVTLLTDLGSAALKQAVEDFVYDRGQVEASRLLIWFAGHGHMVGDEAYLVPVDAPLPAAGDDAPFRRRALSMRDFAKHMAEVRARHVLAIFDSCFSGNVFDLTRALPPAVSKATALPVRQIITSGEAGEVVSDDGSFRKLFLAALAGDEPTADQDGDGYLTGSELGQFLSAKVTNLSNGRQTPRSGKLRELGMDRGDFVFQVAVAAGATVAPPPPPPPPGLPPAPPPKAAVPAGDEVALAWGSSLGLMQGRAVLTVLGSPYGARSDLTGVTVNGERKGVRLGGRLVLDGDTDGCILTLTASGEGVSRFLRACGGPTIEAERKTATLALRLPAMPVAVGNLALAKGETRALMDGRLTVTFLGAPYRARSNLVGLVANGEAVGLGLGGQITADSAGDGCVLTLVEFPAPGGPGQFLLRCGAPSSADMRAAAAAALAL